MWTWTTPGGLRRWTLDQTAGAHVEHMRANPSLTDDDRRKLDGVVDVLGDYVLNGLKYATVSTIAWTPVRDITPRVIVLTSDGVHKVLGHLWMNHLITRHADDPQALADAIVAKAVEPGAAAAHRRYEQALWNRESVYGDQLEPLTPGHRDNATAAVIRIHTTPA